MTRMILNEELRDFASFLVDKYHDVAMTKAGERAAYLAELGLDGEAVNWKVIGEEIAALLATDTSIAMQ